MHMNGEPMPKRAIAAIGLTALGWIVGLALIVLGHQPEGVVSDLTLSLLIYLEATIIGALIVIGLSFMA